MDKLKINVREAVAADVPELWALVHELAIFERAENEHTVTPAQMVYDLQHNRFFAFVAEIEDHVAGMALCYPIYSTWKGYSVYLEDLIVKEKFRRLGIGSKLFDAVVQYSKKTGAGRLGWQVLDWNTPAIEFYKKYEAELDTEWITCRLRQEQLQQFNLPVNESI